MLTSDKVKDIDDLVQDLTALRGTNKRIVQCHGVFDLLHVGHIRHLEQAKRLGDVLVVTVTPDEFVNKGPHRPAFPAELRAEGLAALDCVRFESSTSECQWITHGRSRVAGSSSAQNALTFGMCRWSTSGRSRFTARASHSGKVGLMGAKKSRSQTGQRMSHAGSARSSSSCARCTSTPTSWPRSRWAFTRSPRNRSMPPGTGG